MVVCGWLVLALAGCESDSTSAGELVLAPEEPLCHPWPSCTTWTTDSALALTQATPAKLSDGVKTGHHAVAAFELSVPGESVRVWLKAETRYRLEYEGPEESVIVRAPGSTTELPMARIGHLASASGTRVLEFMSGPEGTYEFVAGGIAGESIPFRLTRM
jgi:hypothetical protein